MASDADELENRFPAGKANLCTSSLYYDALISAGYLGKDLGKPVAAYARQATALKKNIDRYFGGTVEGFDTYKYYEGNDVLRSWICIPLTVGIQDRKDATIQALFSRIITEGMFGIRPTGLNSFVFTPRLPQEWDHMNLRKICAFNQVFDIEVKRLGDQLQVAVIADGKTISNRKIKEGENIRIKF